MTTRKGSENDLKKRKSKKALLIGIAIIVVSVVLLIGAFIGYNKVYLPSLKDVTVAVYKDNGVKIDQLAFKEKSYLQILDEQDQVIERIDLDEQTPDVTLDGHSPLLKDWEIKQRVQKNGLFERDEVYYTAKPTYLENKDFVLTFMTDERSHFFENEQPISSLSKPYKAGEPVTHYLPEPTIDEDFKGYWTLNHEAVTDEIIINEDTVLQFKTYQDKNDNWIDDFSEAFTVNFVTNTGEEIENQVIGWEGTIGLPQLQTLKEENKVFYDWYSDEQLTNVVTNESKVTSDMTLFAKVKSIPEIINTTIEHPITRKDIAIEVQSVLHEQNSDIDKQFNTKVLEEEKERKALKAYNKANNILSEKVEQVTQLHNLGQKKLYLITFLDPLNQYLYSIVAPYGQTIKVVYEDGQLFKEYAVRQDSTIILDQETLLTESSDLDRYDFEYRQINDSVFIKVQPVGK